MHPHKAQARVLCSFLVWKQAGRAQVSEKGRERAEKVYIAADIEESAGVIKSYVGVARHQQTAPAGAAVESSE